jgi:hypothetical protein
MRAAAGLDVFGRHSATPTACGASVAPPRTRGIGEQRNESYRDAMEYESGQAQPCPPSSDPVFDLDALLGVLRLVISSRRALGAAGLGGQCR